jgi:RimJ/RimL family protein N-acetyltransferase
MAQDKRPVLTDGTVTLRPATLDDVAARLALGNSQELHRLFGGDPRQFREITPEAAAAWVNAQINDSHAWIITHSDALVGSVRLHSINHADLRANLAIGILDTTLLGQGIGPRAMRLLATHAFAEMGLHRLTTRVLADNARAIAAYEKVGFVQEGRERQSARIGDQWLDDVIMGLLASEFVPRS